MNFCPNCGKNIQSDMKFCPGCGQTIGGAWQEERVPYKPTDMGSATMPNQREEPTLYSDGKRVRVTRTRLMIDSTTYSMANITSIRTSKKPAKRGCGIFLCIMGVIILIATLAVFRIIGGVGIAVGAFILLIGIIAACVPKATYTVHVSSAAGEVDECPQHDRANVERIVRAINEALVKRG